MDEKKKVIVVGGGGMMLYQKELEKLAAKNQPMSPCFGPAHAMAYDQSIYLDTIRAMQEGQPDPDQVLRNNRNNMRKFVRQHSRRRR